MLTTIICVRFAKTPAEGFDAERYYQVYAIDPFTGDDNEDQTRFLLADKHGKYQWVQMSDVRRFNPRKNRNVIVPGRGVHHPVQTVEPDGEGSFFEDQQGNPSPKT